MAFSFIIYHNVKNYLQNHSLMVKLYPSDLQHRYSFINKFLPGFYSYHLQKCFFETLNRTNEYFDNKNIKFSGDVTNIIFILIEVILWQIKTPFYLQTRSVVYHNYIFTGFSLAVMPQQSNQKSSGKRCSVRRNERQFCMNRPLWGAAVE